MDNWLVLKNVALPLELGERFIAPDLEKALEYYPDWKRYSGLDWTIQGYLCAIMKEIDRKKPNGYTGEKAVGELLTYVGLERFVELIRGT